MIAREGPFLQKSPLPRAPSRKDALGGDSGGEAASLREAPLPQTPSPEEQLGISLTFPPNLRPHGSWARFLASWLWSRRLTEPPRPASVGLRYQFIRGDPKGRWGRSESPHLASAEAKSFRVRRRAPQRLPPQRELSCAARMTEDTPLRLRRRAPKRQKHLPPPRESRCFFR